MHSHTGDHYHCGYGQGSDRSLHFLGVRYLFRMYWATPSRMNMAVQNRKCVIIKYARSPVFMGQAVMIGNGCSWPGSCTPFWVYHSLPRSVLTVRTPLVLLVWSGWSLPLLTIPPIWVRPGRVPPLPIITAWRRQLTIDQTHQRVTQ